MWFLDALLMLCAALVAVPAVLLLVEVIAARSAHSGIAGSAGRRPPVAVVIPAHDEELVLKDALDGVRSQLREGDAIWVVADNCSDGTADLARTSGATVIERVDPDRRGKGYALRFGFDALAEAPPEVVVVIDADCRIEPGTLDALAASAAATGRPAQATYVFEAPADAGGFGAISQLAILLKNQVRPMGLHRLGWPCQLAGSGMALPWNAIERVAPDATSVVEDMQLGVDLTRAGLAPHFVPHARVTALLPKGGRAALEQRRRWEHGHLYTLTREGPRLILHALVQRDWRALALGLDLMVPPLSFLLFAIAAVGVCSAAAVLLGGSIHPLALSVVAGLAVTLAVLRTWWSFGRHLASARELATAPLYALRKLPLYLAYPARRERRWIRTERDAPEDHDPPS